MSAGVTVMLVRMNRLPATWEATPARSLCLRVMLLTMLELACVEAGKLCEAFQKSGTPCFSVLGKTARRFVSVALAVSR